MFPCCRIVSLAKCKHTQNDMGSRDEPASSDTLAPLSNTIKVVEAKRKGKGECVRMYEQVVYG